jgi:hypothetical protein
MENTDMGKKGELGDEMEGSSCSTTQVSLQTVACLWLSDELTPLIKLQLVGKHQGRRSSVSNKSFPNFQ